ncbi:tetratricopeptide repeat-containing sulfotransferase family protein [Litoreibacter janthinus]|uniref:Tetratricopeptide repeat-containing protein n=1 Tax=Litoreibacter janthinus TaxID=670154 RepID=A0A1I6GGW6_9RHOB|nr:sulfotransferase [Litoreibacter janthinus]SFR41418.1 Tetratricopeptide repeat-containing protein [Litoreibacter janthinus]
MANLSNQQIKDLFAKARHAQEKGQLDDAERGYKRLLKSAPNLPEVNFNLGEIFALRGKFAEAADRFEVALKLRPNEPAIWASYLNLAAKHPNPKNFDLLRERARPVLGATAAFAFFEGVASRRDEKWKEAAGFFKSAIESGFRQARVYAEYGSTLVELKQFDLAMEQFDKGLSASPENDVLLFRKASLLQSMGRIDEARTAVQRAIKQVPNAGAYHALYASLTKMGADDPNIAVMKTALKSKRAGDGEIPSVAYALAKAMEDSGQFGKVFNYLNIANTALAKTYPYDVPAVKASAERIRDLYDQIKELDGPICAASPIFVTGAPRSGTTLVEQILASHSKVEGGGELGIVQPKFSNLISGPDSEWGGDGMALLTKFTAAATEFEEELKRRFPHAQVVTDKSISSYAIMGFLAKAMPNARFVVVRRDPFDNALSIYKNQFREGLHRYANNLEHIAFFLRQFEDMVEFWREQCPGVFHEIRYEDLIAEPEAQSRALVKAVGLDWEDSCLSFYETKREVRTLSATQVRQPMYSSSVGAWKKFDRDMAPFVKAYDNLGKGR